MDESRSLKDDIQHLSQAEGKGRREGVLKLAQGCWNDHNNQKDEFGIRGKHC